MTIAEFGILLTLLLTVIGWSVTYYYQKKILERQILAEKERETRKVVLPRMLERADKITLWLNEGQSLARRYIYVSSKKAGYLNRITGVPKDEIPIDNQDEFESETARISNEMQAELHNIREKYVEWMDRHGHILELCGSLAFYAGAEDLASATPQLISDYADAIYNVVFANIKNATDWNEGLLMDQMSEKYMELLQLVWIFTNEITSDEMPPSKRA